ncbi:hypothetical protein L3V59_40105 [Burkholderia aenigmatica]|uniref:hypothetical protein n=1 Tax=Burkholderia aenigmatica TaxID=2015348 RepID=UPI001F1E0DBD|nr:hypothetical protein [Burkholderia aenigmatica]UKD16871.1 hypothetical protein L3V59_40105 [Burkholderia aenigmatica]
MSNPNHKSHGPEAAPDPVSYMRTRRPSEYSDSELASSLELTQGFLEYHLETLTSRSQETEFAYFARRLAEKEICPNLRPQTGPTGGGDSKADSETIPVSGELAELWVGSDPAAAHERWAFAFSAKKDWKSKVRSDVRNIASTNRGYTRIYFITNQFAPDKSRAESEDTLSRETGIRVVILDRSWITKAVIENGRVDIAIEALKIEDLRPLVERKIGPADLERRQELDELEKAIADPDYYQGARYQQAEDALRAAILARGLGRPRTEIDGLFIRAERIANTSENVKQRLRIAYNYAWTVVFWFNDLQQLNVLHDTVEAFGLSSMHMEDVELVMNLWMVLSSQVQRKVISGADAKIEARRNSLTTALERLASESMRPNNALQARTALVFLAMHDVMVEGVPEARGDIWKALSQIVVDAENLGDYPFERLAKLIEEISALGVDDEEFDQLFESVVAALEKRRGEAAGAGMLRERGIKKLEAGKPYEAISLLGRAMERFVKREHRHDLIFCLVTLYHAYLEVGLLWAARCCALSACERCLAYFAEEGRLLPLALTCVRKLTEVELRLGRIAHTLTTIELEKMLAPQLMLRDDRLESFNEHLTKSECMLGILMLASSLPQLKEMGGLPEVLEAQGLFMAKGFLLYALGYRDELRNEGFTEERWSDDDIDSFMCKAFGQPGRLQMPERPQIEAGSRVNYHSTVLGCHISIEAPATTDGISTAEAVLATIEAFFATSLNERVMPYRPTARIVVEPVDHLAEGLRVSKGETDDEAFLLVQYATPPQVATPEMRKQFRDGLMAVVLHFIIHIAVVEDPDRYMDRIAGEERGFARALIYAETSLTQENVFGSGAKVLVNDWQPPADARQFPLKRAHEWSDDVEITQLPLSADDSVEPTAPADLRSFFDRKLESQPHSSRRIISLIDIPLWNQAKWRAVFYFYDPSQAPLPVFCLGYAEKEAAQKIFSGWQKQFGKHDTNNEIRVVILRGIMRSNPAAYRVFITGNVRSDGSAEIIVSVGRHQTMTPSTTANLDMFLKTVSGGGSYLLAPAHFVSSDQFPDVGFGVAIQKDEIVVRQAWEIGPNDIDSGAILADDDPVIPSNAKNPPVRELLQLKASLKT